MEGEEVLQEGNIGVEQMATSPPGEKKPAGAQPSPKSNRRSKPLLHSLLGIVLAVGLVFIGYQLGQTRQVEFKPSPAMIPTPTSLPHFDSYSYSRLLH